MRGKSVKKAVQEIHDHAYYANISDACKEAMRRDTPEAYRSALEKIVNYEQWQRLLGASTDIAAFIEENKSRLKMKETAE